MAVPETLISDYLAGVDELKAATAGLSPEQVRARPVPGKWSTLEVVCHIADFEPVFADRMKRIIALDNPLLMGADERAFSQALVYSQRDLAEELNLIAAVRLQMARILRALPESVLERSGVHSERGSRSLHDMLASATGHVRHHLPFIYEKRRAMGITD